MDLQLQDQRFLICGASSGFGRAIAELLLEEGARVLAVARRAEKLEKLRNSYPNQAQTLAGDITEPDTHNAILKALKGETLHGALINAGGPPALAALETDMEQWDEAYRLVLRWKVKLALQLVPLFTTHHYGRLLFLESQSVKQPISSLVLSNAFRAGVTGFAKTLSAEVASKGITVNVLAPGSHETPAINRVIQKQSEETGKSFEVLKKEMEAGIPVGRLGSAEEIASLALWLLSSRSGYVTGQTISHAGGSINGLFG